jgi:hypothetical protein
MMRIGRRSLTRSVLTRQRTSASSWLRDWCEIRSRNLIGDDSGSWRAGNFAMQCHVVKRLPVLSRIYGGVVGA